MAKEANENPKPQAKQTPIGSIDQETIDVILRAQSHLDKTMPITWINEPEAHEDAVKAGKNLWTEAMKLLKNRNYLFFKTKNGHIWSILNPKQYESIVIPQDTDLIIRSTVTKEGETEGETVLAMKINDYFLTPKGVIMFERNMANETARMEPRPTKDPSIIKEEIGRDEINKLINILKQAADSEFLETATETSQPLLKRGVSINLGTGDISELRKEITKPPIIKAFENMRRRLARKFLAR